MKRPYYCWTLVLLIMTLVLLIMFLRAGRNGETQATSESRQRVAVCLYGVVGRSIRWTWPNIESQVIAPLEKAGWRVTIYIFNMQVGTAQVDNNVIDPNAAKNYIVVPSSAAGREVLYEEEQQLGPRVEAVIDAKMREPWSRMYIDNGQNRNALRAMYSEMRVGRFLLQNQAAFDVAIALSADSGFPLPIPVSTVLEASKKGQQQQQPEATSDNKDVAYLTCTNDGNGGYTDGFYLGRPEVLAKFMMRLDAIPGPWYNKVQLKIAPDNRTITRISSPNYEVVLRQSLEHFNITRREVPFVFYKVRSDGWLHLIGRKGLGTQPWMSSANLTTVMKHVSDFRKRRSNETLGLNISTDHANAAAVHAKHKQRKGPGPSSYHPGMCWSKGKGPPNPRGFGVPSLHNKYPNGLSHYHVDQLLEHYYLMGAKNDKDFWPTPLDAPPSPTTPRATPSQI